MIFLFDHWLYGVGVSLSLYAVWLACSFHRTMGKAVIYEWSKSKAMLKFGCMAQHVFMIPRALTNIPAAAFLSRTASRSGASPGERCRAAAAAAAVITNNNHRCPSHHHISCWFATWTRTGSSRIPCSSSTLSWDSQKNHLGGTSQLLPLRPLGGREAAS